MREILLGWGPTARIAALALVLLAGLPSGASAQAPDPIEVAWATAQQEQFPAWEGRRAAANAKEAARRGWFDGEPGASFATAFPKWVGSPLNRPTALRGRLAELDAADVQRARERQKPPPELGKAARVATWREKRAEVLEAEAAGDGLERRLLVEVLAVLEANPQLTASRLAGVRATWEVQANEVPPVDADGELQEEVAAGAARADRWLRELDGLVGTLLVDSARDRGTPEVGDRLESLVPGGEGEGAAVQLALLWSFLDPADEARVDEALAGWWKGRTWPEPGADRGVEAQRIRMRLPAAPGPAAWQQARAEALSARLAALERTVPTAASEPEEGAPADPADQARRAEEEAVLAQYEADEALANAADARARRRAEVLRALADARRRSAELWGKAEIRQEEAQNHDDALDEKLAGIDNKINAIRNRRIGESAPDPDAVYRTVRELSQQLRGDPVARGVNVASAHRTEAGVEQLLARDRSRIADAATWAKAITDPMVQAEVDAALETWADQLDEQTGAADSLVVSAVAERDATLRALTRLREQRRTLRAWTSASERYRDQGFLLKDVAQELALLGPSLVMRGRARLDTLIAVPGRLTDFNLLRGLAGTVVWAILWVGAWVWVRSQAEEAARLGTNRLHQLRPELRPADLRLLEDPVARFLRAFVDLLLGWLLVGRLGALVPELGFVVLVYLQIALYRALLAAFDLLVIPTEHVRPAVLVLRREPFDLARNTFRYLVGLLIARSFIYRLLWDVLGLDVIAGLVTTGFMLALLALVGWALFRWEPHLRSRMRQRNQGTPVVAFLSRPPENALVQPLRGAAIVLFFVVDALVELTYWLARERSGVAWLMHAFTRYREKEEGPQMPPVDEEVAEAIGKGGGPIELSRPEVRTEVAAAIEMWRKEARRGLVALVGDRGSCKGLACDRVLTLLDDCEIPRTEFRLERQLVTERDMLDWMAEIFELEAAPDPDSVAAALLELEPQAWVLRDAHRAWTRQVGGFEAITTLLYVLNGTSHHHFWVLSMHRLSWEFFASSGSLVDVGVFRRVISLKGLTAVQLRELCVGRTEAAGFRLDTSRLMRNSAFGGDPVVEEERGTHLFFRLLAEASEGNPSVALHLWVQCLHPTEDPEVLQVYAGEALVANTVADLSDAALFTLAALRVQDELGENELVEVTNLPRAVVRATLRDLISRDLVMAARERLRIPEARLPEVTRTLRRRHFLHLGAA